MYTNRRERGICKEEVAFDWHQGEMAFQGSDAMTQSDPEANNTVQIVTVEGQLHLDQCMLLSPK